jgi:short-subunit dehydrogenase
MNNVNNKVVVITGAGSGIGRELAILLATRGAKLALNSRTPENLKETISLLNIPQEKLLTRAFDISDKEAVFSFASHVNQYFGTVDVVINNAGVAITGLTFEELEIEDFDWIFSVNFMGVVITSKAFLPFLRKNSNKTALVNISSVFGLVPMALKTPYCSSKYAVAGFTDSLRMELDNTSINVMGVYPGGVKTGVTINALKAEKEPEYTKEFNKNLKMEPEKAAQIILGGILKGKEKVIIGNDAKKAILAYRYFPFILKKLARKTMLKFKSKQ